MTRLILPAIVLSAAWIPSISNANDHDRPLQRMLGRAAAIAVDQAFNIPWNVQVSTDSQIGDNQRSVAVSVAADPQVQYDNRTTGRKVYVHVNTSQVHSSPPPAPTVHHTPATVGRHCYPCYPRRVVYRR